MAATPTEALAEAGAQVSPTVEMPLVMLLPFWSNALMIVVELADWP